MNISELFNELANKDFQDPATGNLFFPAYIFTYDPEKEYQIREEIENLKERLIRPDNYIDCLMLNIYNEFISFLKKQMLGEESLFDLIITEDKNDVGSMDELLIQKAHSEDFFGFVNEKAKNHFELAGKYKKVYLLLYGFGSIFPYLRTSVFLTNFERFLSGSNYKLIVFFPGNYKNEHYHLFKLFDDENVYRATLINR